MSLSNSTDWNPGAYARFRGLRLRPALDLLAQVGALPAGDVVDLGCGDGAVAGALRMRFPAARKGPSRRLIGVDNSAAMLAEARGYDATVEVSIAEWQPDTPPALIFSNAALQWLGDHETLLPRLIGFLAPGGVLAVQMPRQIFAPSHRFLRDIAVAMFPEKFDFTGYRPPVAQAAEYYGMLCPWGKVNAWETEYIQHLEPVIEGHPVRAFTASTAMRPIADRLNGSELAKFLEAYDKALGAAYPVLPDGSALMAFKRLFLTVQTA